MPKSLIIQLERRGQEINFPDFNSFQQYRKEVIEGAPSYLAASICREIAEQTQLEFELAVKIGAPFKYLEGVCLIFGRKTRELFRQPAVVLAVLDPNTCTNIVVSATAGVAYVTIATISGTIQYLYPSAEALVPGY